MKKLPECLFENFEKKQLFEKAIMVHTLKYGFGDLLYGYAIGWLSVKRPGYPAVASVGGGRSAIFIYPNGNLSVVVLTNLQGASQENFIDQITKYYFSKTK